MSWISLLCCDFGRKEAVPFIKDFISLAPTTKAQLWSKSRLEIIKRASKKTFPNNPQKKITVHDLRHSYAIHILNQGIFMALVAKALGNSILVCEEHYSDFELSDEGIEAVLSRLS